MRTTIRLPIYLFGFLTLFFYFNFSTSKQTNFVLVSLKRSIKFIKNNVKMSRFTVGRHTGNYSITTYKLFKSMKHLYKDLGEEDRPKYTDKMPVCKLNLSLLGPVLVNKTELRLKWVEEKYPEIRGGFYAPTNCRARHKVAILVSYRDREDNLATFLNHMHTFLKKQHLQYRIFVIEQFGPERFNKGSLYNVGFLESQRFGNWNCMVFHDVDLLPLDERILYSCPRAPTHMSPAIESSGYKLQYTRLFGGVTVLTPAQFEAANGYSNLYWGWGAEDDDMFVRLQARRYQVLRYNQSIARYAVLPHETRYPNEFRYYLLSLAKHRYKTEGLNTLRYILVNAIKKKLFIHIIADVSPDK